jgi:hypothetical protein
MDLAVGEPATEMGTHAGGARGLRWGRMEMGVEGDVWPVDGEDVRMEMTARQ